jgi:hypothetical protein
MNKKQFFSALGLLISLSLLSACGSADKDMGQCTDADCARAVTAKAERNDKDEPAEQKSAPGTITVVCGVFNEDAEVPAPCGPVLVKVLVDENSKPKAEMTLSGDRLVVPNIGSNETVTLNLHLQGCEKVNLLPGLKSGDTRETYFKTPCK